jgi:hypothetical protein
MKELRRENRELKERVRILEVDVRGHEKDYAEMKAELAAERAAREKAEVECQAQLEIVLATYKRAEKAEAERDEAKWKFKQLVILTKASDEPVPAMSSEEKAALDAAFGKPGDGDG